jgi:uncharacterized membrane protein (DUF485 family)
MMTQAVLNGRAARDWAAIERMPEFQELTTSRRRFAWLAGGTGLGLGALYVVLAAIAHGLMGTKLIGSFTVGFAGGVALIVLTWAITWAYMRRSERVWSVLEERVREKALLPGRRPVRARDTAPNSVPTPEVVVAGQAEAW